MIRMGHAFALATTMVFVLAASGNAQDDASENIQPDFARNGFYLGLSGTKGQELFEDDIEDDLNSVLKDNGYAGPSIKVKVEKVWGFTGRAGYRFHPNVSAEAQIEILTGDDAKGPKGEISASGVGEVAEFSIIPMVYTANVKGYVLTGPIQPFVLVGAGLMTTKTRVHSLQAPRFSETERDSGFVARFGGGVDFYMTKTLALTTGVDYVRPFGSGIKDLQYISYNVGLLARF